MALLKCLNLVFIITSFMCLTKGSPFSKGDSSVVSNYLVVSQYEESSWIFLVVLSVSSLITIITVLFICGSAGCCRLSKIHWFGRTRQSQERGPMSFENPVADLGLCSGNAMPLSQIDVRALEMNPVLFEPLPQIHDLSPLSLGSGGNGNVSEIKSDGRMLPSNQMGNPKSVIIPFATEDSELYAHDWFDEPYQNFQRNNLEFIREVGKGWFGEVLEADAREIVPFADKIRVLVKRLRQEANQIDQMRFLDESRIYRDANQRNILKLLGQSIEKLPFLLIMEHCPQGDLKSYLIANVTRAEILSSQGTILNMALDIAKGLQWMINADFKHPDLAARNCQVTGEGRIVIGDYGLSTQLFKDDYYWNSNVPIPLRWAAPETIYCTTTTIQTLKVTKLSNIWTYAVVLWEITEFAKLPYFELSDEEVITRVLAEKSYFLGQPTLPYIPMKEELHEIMRLCWSIDPNNRPSMSKVVAQLQALQEKVEKEKKSEEFDSKWDRFGRLSSSSSFDVEDNSKPRNSTKKSVSFTGIKNLTSTLEALSPEDSIDEPERGLDDSKSIAAISQEQLNENQKKEEEEWMKEIEEGGISEKMGKSQSVQDLYQLTHVEPSDIHGPESLMEITRSTCETNSEFRAANSTDYFGECSDQTSTTDLGLNSSENEILVEGTDESMESEQKSSHLFFPEISIVPSTPGTTPNMTGIDIVVQNPSPFLPLEEENDQNITNSIMNATSTASKCKLIFDFSEPDKPMPPPSKNSVPLEITKPRRHTSTPKRSDSSPVIAMNVCNEALEDVFVDNNEVLNETCNLSPIALKMARRGIIPGELASTVQTILGASDELGLGVFQGVTSQIENYSKETFSNDSSETEEFDAIATTVKKNEKLYKQNGHHITEANAISSNGKSPFGDDMPVLAGNIQKGEPMSMTPHPGTSNKIQRRVLFENPVKTESTISSDSGTVESAQTMINDDKNGSSWDIIDSNGTFNKCVISDPWDVVSMQSKISKETSAFETSSEFENLSGQELKLDIRPLSFQLGESTKKIQDTEEIEDGEKFWNRQMESVTNAAKDTKSLFALSLGTVGLTSTKIISPKLFPSDKFVEDIQAANEELGSLVVENYEDDSCIQVVPESRHENDCQIEVKLAFAGGVTTNDTEQSNCETTFVVPWNHSKTATAEANQPLNSEDQHLKEIGEDCDDDEASSGLPSLTRVEFFPSKWTPSLEPKCSAIKSPSALDASQQHDQKSSSCLKKSVSFERKKNQIVYEYPPPPPASDSEEESHLGKITPTIPMHSSLDWDLTQEELEFAEIHPDDSDDDVTVKSNPMDIYRISGFEELDDFNARLSNNQPFNFPPSNLGELRHTKNTLKLDLTGEASLLDNETKTKTEKSFNLEQVLDSGKGSSVNDSPKPFVSPSETK